MKRKIINLLLVLLLSISVYGQTIEIHQIDIGTGDATLIKVANTAGNINILIDAGQKSASSTVLDYLSSPTGGNLGVTPYLDYVITSHYHEDHLGGFVGSKKRDRNSCYNYYGVLGWPNRDVEVYAVLDKGNAAPVPGSQVFKDYKMLANKGNRRIAVGTTVVGQPGAVGTITPPAHQSPPLAPVNQNLSLGGYIDLGVDANNIPIRLRLVIADGYVYDPSANPQYIDVPAVLNINRNSPGAKKNPNNWGLAWVLEYGKFRYFTGGDMGGYNVGAYFNLETPLSTTLPLIYTNPATAPGHICAFKVSHHGSEESSNEAFLAAIRSTSAVFSSGPQSTFGHPRQDVINRIDTTNWNAANLGYNHTMAMYFTELNFVRNISTTKGATSGNVGFVLTDQYVDPAIQTDSTQMANGSYIYEIDTTAAGFVKGDIRLEVFSSYNNDDIDDLSVFQVYIKSFNGGAWVGPDIFSCHD